MKTVKIGNSAPDFTLKDQDENDVSLENLLGKDWVLLAFYPGDFTPVCTMQLCEYRDNFEDLSSLNVQLIGISGDSPASHKRFKEQKNLPFTLLSDPGHQVAKLYGMKDLFGMSKRSLVLIDPEGIVRHVAVEVVSLFYRKHKKIMEDLQKILS